MTEVRISIKPLAPIACRNLQDILSSQGREGGGGDLANALQDHSSLFRVFLLSVRHLKCKVGRPNMDASNVFSPDVTPEQRLVMLRHVANRNSARRMRDTPNKDINRLLQKVSRQWRN